MKQNDMTYPNNLTPANNALDIKSFWLTLKQQRYLIFLTITIALAFSLIISLLMKPVYRATTVIEIDRQLANISGLGALNADDPRDNRDFYQTQYELIKSRSIAKEVIDILDLRNSQQSVGIKTKIKQMLGLNSSQPDLEGIFIENILVEPVNTSRLVRVSYDAKSPEEAAKIVNTLAQVFVSNNIKRNEAAAADARKTLNSQLEKVKKDLQEIQQASSEFANEHTYINGEPQEVFKKKKLIEELEKALETISDLKSQPIQNETQRNNLQFAERKEQNLRVEIDSLEKAIYEQKDEMLEYESLQEALNSAKAAHTSLQQQLKNVNIASGSTANKFIVVDEAIPPRKKHKPNILLNLIFGGLLGGLIGIATAFLKDYLDDSFKFVDDVETATGLPVLAFTPETSDDGQIALTPCLKPGSPIAEAYRTLKTSLKFIPEANGENAIFITSATENEGKTTTAANLACLYAKSGKSVLLIDADLRNPSLHNFFNIEKEDGLEELLTGTTAPRDDLFKATAIPNVSIITAGKTTNDPVNLIGSTRMEKILEVAIARYDHVIIDGAPVLGFADALILTNLATATLLVIQAEYTPKTAIKNTLQRLKQANSTPIGVLLTQVNMQKANEQYGRYPNSSTNKSKSDKKNKSSKLGRSINK